MKDEVRKHLHDVHEAALAAQQFVAGRSYEDYTRDEFLRSAVERKLQVIGEALVRLRRDEPGVLEAIREHRDIISFRNLLVHGYDSLDHRIVWEIVDTELGPLLDDVTKLLA